MADQDHIMQVSVNELQNFRNHTFQVKDDEAMKKLEESVRENGILMPILAFRNEDGDLEVISGHRRLFAAKKVGLTEVPVLLRKTVRTDATLLMGEANFTCREKIYPSEKAFTYKAMLTSLQKKMEGEDRGTETCRDILSQYVGESSTQIQRYIRLTELIPELLELVDLRKIGFQTAVELSYMDGDSQREILKIYQETERKPSLAEAKELRAIMEKEDLDADRIRGLLAGQEESVKAEEYKLVFHSPVLCAILADCHSVTEREMRIIRGLKLLEQIEQERRASVGILKSDTEGGGDIYGG